MIKIAFGEDFMNCTQVFEWSHHFKDGGRSAESDECPRWQSMRRNSKLTDKVHALFRSDRKLTITEISEKVDFDRFTSCHCDWRSGHETSSNKVCPTTADNQTRGELLVRSHRLASVHRIRCRLFGKHYHWQWNMHLQLWSWQKGPVIGWEISFVPTAKKAHPSSKWVKVLITVFFIKMVFWIMNLLQQVKE